MFIDTLKAKQEVMLLARDTLSALNVSFRNVSVLLPTNVQGQLTGERSLKPHVYYTGLIGLNDTLS